jgi:tRNA A37 N6-isopentenylltransferase MiaA
MEALAEAIEASTRQLVRKQETWLRKQIPVDTVRVPRPDEPAPASLF